MQEFTSEYIDFQTLKDSNFLRKCDIFGNIYLEMFRDPIYPHQSQTKTFFARYVTTNDLQLRLTLYLFLNDDRNREYSFSIDERIQEITIRSTKEDRYFKLKYDSNLITLETLLHYKMEYDSYLNVVKYISSEYGIILKKDVYPKAAKEYAHLIEINFLNNQKRIDKISEELK